MSFERNLWILCGPASTSPSLSASFSRQFNRFHFLCMCIAFVAHLHLRLLASSSLCWVSAMQFAAEKIQKKLRKKKKIEPNECQAPSILAALNLILLKKNFALIYACVWELHKWQQAQVAAVGVAVAVTDVAAAAVVATCCWRSCCRGPPFVLWSVVRVSLRTSIKFFRFPTRLKL